mmetsp:Transcript_7988/g.13032  ORF Transcript_7988/g.13032 Transcript_7988/m.13032 type:complete len:89 (-) Transcript_7988:714-980(-)
MPNLGRAGAAGLRPIPVILRWCAARPKGHGAATPEGVKSRDEDLWYPLHRGMKEGWPMHAPPLPAACELWLTRDKMCCALAVGLTRSV